MSRVDDLAAGRMLRMLRLRRRLRLADLAARSRLSASALGRHERGIILSLSGLRRHAAALDVRIELLLVGRGADLPRLRDSEHAAIVNVLAARYASAGWIAQAEVSFSQYGERGRIDLLAATQAPGAALLHVVEVKTELADLQDVLGSLDVKRRLAPAVARRLGWPAARVAVVLALASTAHNRSVVRRHSSLFGGFAPQTLRQSPHVADARNDRVLLWVPPAAAKRGTWLAGRRRMRRRGRPAAGAVPGGPE